LHIPILGVLHRQDSITLPDRHLGLIPTDELQNLDAVIDQLAHFAQEWFDWEQLMPLLRNQKAEGRRQEAEKAESSVISHWSSDNEGQETKDKGHTSLASPPFLSAPTLRIAIAQDAAFSFYYQDNLDLLVEMGAELVPWSPLHDSQLPEALQGLYFGGGFPEMFAEQLAANSAVLASVRTAIQSGLPTYAECGGLMYLCQKIVDFQEFTWDMIGALPTAAVMGKRLTLGYRQVEAVRDSIMLRKGAIAWGHEFHRSHLTTQPNTPLFKVKTEKVQTSAIEGWHLPNLHASYVHLHWGTNLELPMRFLKVCQKAS